VLTRPVGASFADYVAFPHSFGGLGAGHGPVALFLTFLIIIFVAYMSVTRKDVEEAPPSARPGHRRGVPSATEYQPPYQGERFDEQAYQPRPGPSPYQRGPFDEQAYQSRSGRSPYQDGPFDEHPYPPEPGRSPYPRGSFDEQPDRPRPGRPPYQRGPFDEEPYPPRPRDGEPRRPPEGFFAWDDR
jgi:hypothetical protein